MYYYLFSIMLTHRTGCYVLHTKHTNKLFLGILYNDVIVNKYTLLIYRLKLTYMLTGNVLLEFALQQVLDLQIRSVGLAKQQHVL